MCPYLLSNHQVDWVASLPELLYSYLRKRTVRPSAQVLLVVDCTLRVGPEKERTINNTTYWMASPVDAGTSAPRGKNKQKEKMRKERRGFDEFLASTGRPSASDLVCIGVYSTQTLNKASFFFDPKSEQGNNCRQSGRPKNDPSPPSIRGLSN